MSGAANRMELPVDYYLQHFAEFLARVQQQYQHLLGEPEHRWIADFSQLPADAKRLWLRMLNRKGSTFAVSALSYQEITDQVQAIDDLRRQQFVAIPATAQDAADWLLRADKARLWQLIERAAAQQPALLDGLKKNADKASLQHFVTEHALVTPSNINAIEPLLSLRRLDTLQYLMFLFFGQIEADLSAFTLRDLGVRPSGQFKTSFAPRFLDLATAQVAFCYAQFKQQLRQQLPKSTSRLTATQLLQWQQSFGLWPVPLDERTLQLKEQLCYQLGRQSEKLQSLEDAILWYQRSATFASSERLLQLYRQLQRSDELHLLLEQMQTDPSCDEEYYLAIDFAKRYQGIKRRSDLTQMLHDAPVLQIDELYRQQVEVGVGRALIQQGWQAAHVENNLWLALFALLFWRQLFETEQSAIFNEFERRPRNLATRDFYQQQHTELEQQLELLAQPESACRYLLQQATVHYGKHNALFAWHADLALWISVLVRGAPAAALATMLRKMAQDFRHYSSGFPDLLVWQETADGHIHALKFMEVKAPGDAIRRHQLSRLRALQESGIDVELCKVQWWQDPNRIYAVVDVETTGGQHQTDRITEIAIVRVQHGKVLDRFSSLVNPNRRIPSFISRLTGITDGMVAQAPVFADIATQVLALLEGCIFVAHNVRFDHGFVQAEFARIQQPFQLAQLCTVVESRRAFPGLTSYSLANLCQHFAITLSTHHRALADAEAAAMLLLKIQHTGEPV